MARKLRRAMSYPEVLLWQRLRGQATGLRFRKQHPVGPYVADFCCLTPKLVVEVDSAVHDGLERSVRDARRDDFMKQNGFRVLRVTAFDIQSDMPAVIAGIVAFADGPLHPSPLASGPPPRSGEDM